MGSSGGGCVGASGSAGMLMTMTRIALFAQQVVVTNWARPPVPPFDPVTTALTFQQLELDHYVGDPVPGMTGLQYTMRGFQTG